MYKNILGTVVISASLLLGQAAFAESMCGEGLSKMVQSIKLDDAQKEKIKPIMDQLKSSIKDNATQMRDLDTQMKQQTESASMDQSKVDDLIDQKTKLIGNMMKAKMKAKGEVAGILTPQQKTDFQNMLKKSEDKMAAKFKSCHDQD